MRKFCIALVCLVGLSCATAPLAQAKASKSSGDSDKAKIEALYDQYMKAFIAKDVNTIMSLYSPKDLFVFDVVPPREYPSWDAYKKDWEGLFAAFPGPVQNKMSDLSITVVGPVAYAHNIQTGQFTGKDGSKLDLVVRVSDVLRKIDGKWLIVQEHVSVPVDLTTGKPDLLSKP
jgi:ketosteroid isomerase-like protein